MLKILSEIRVSAAFNDTQKQTLKVFDTGSYNIVSQQYFLLIV